MSIRSFALVAVLVGACQSSSSSSSPAPKAKEAGSAAGSAAGAAPAPAGSASGPGSGAQANAYGRDIDRICNAEKYSGALEQPVEARQLMVAQWLGPNLESTEAHAFLVKIQPLGGADKAAALDAEAKKVGLPDCPIARAWKP